MTALRSGRPATAFARPRRLRLAGALALCLGLGGRPATGQDPPPPAAAPALPASTLLQQLALRTTGLDQAVQLCAALQDRPLLVRQQRFDAVRLRYAEARLQFAQQRQRVLQRAQKALPGLQKKLLGPKGPAEVQRLREEARLVTAAPDLTKERIHRELDPRLQRLRELLEPAPEQLLLVEPDLAAAVQALRQQLDALRGWRDLYVAMQQDLDADPAGRRHVDAAPQEPEPPDAAAIDRDLQGACAAAMAPSARDAKVLAANDALAAQVDPGELAGTAELNRIRLLLGLPALRLDEKLCQAARDHSQDMHKLGFFAHESPVPGKRTPGERAARFGTSGGAENIAAGQATGEGAIRAWWYSPGHHKNMLGGHGRTGLGRCEQLWTQMFGG